MDRDDETRDLKDLLRQYADSVLAKSAGGYVCPLCGSGTREHKTGALYVYDGGRKWKCHSCGSGGDVYDLIGAVEHIGDFKERKDRARALLGGGLAAGGPAAARPSIAADDEGGADAEPDFSEFLEEARSRLEEPACLDYLAKRGLSVETARRHGLGFCAEWRHPSPRARAAPTSPRLIIPTSKHGYLARDVRESLTAAQERYAKSKAGKTRIFGLDAALDAGKAVFIVEGEIDALSIIEAGGEAIALGSASNVNLFFAELGERRFSCPLVLSLDDDESGRRAEAELAAGLADRGLPFIRFGVSNGLKDANEALCADRRAFARLVAEGERRVNEMAGSLDEGIEMNNTVIETKPKGDEAKSKDESKKKSFLSMCVAARARGFGERTREIRNERCLSTGLKSLDDALGGGLYPGLYILGGGTSVGKTAFMLQMADAIAREECEAAQELKGQERARRGVLYFSLETGADELMARSVSRLSRMRGKERAVKYSDILDGFRSAGFEGAGYDDAMKTFQDCLIEHEGYGAFEFVHESIAGISVDGILECIRAFEPYTGLKPVVFVDYLQIIPHNDIVSDKRAVDASIVALKLAARERNVPIIAASSINRASYGEDVGMASYKESGGIEYTADVLLGLQWKDCGDVSDRKNQKEADAVREKAEARNRQAESPIVLVKVLKNRRGAAYRQAELTFEKPFAYFAESGGASAMGRGARAFTPKPRQ